MTGKSHEEWLRQADYDMDTPEFLHREGRHFYAVFMCHLSVEKAIKGLYQRRVNGAPPKTHNLTQIVNATGVGPPERIERLLIRLNEASISTRYPDDIEAALGAYTAEAVGAVLAGAREAIQWIKQQF